MPAEKVAPSAPTTVKVKLTRSIATAATANYSPSVKPGQDHAEVSGKSGQVIEVDAATGKWLISKKYATTVE